MSDQTPTTEQAKIPEPELSGETETPQAAEANPAPPEDESTIGTGTSMALGCVAGTILLIGFGLLYLALSTLR